MKLKKILVVYKKSAFDVYARERRDRHFLKLLRRNHDLIQRFVGSDKRHHISLKQVKEILKKRDIQATYSYRSSAFKEKKYDLVLTVGGDGTFLEASHHVRKVPILGLNSSPIDSVGMFCGITSETLEEALKQLEKNKLSFVKLNRLELIISGRNMNIPAVNDILIANSNPASTTRYLISFKGRNEEHKSSGIWVSTPAGSTAVTASAGGKILPIHANSFQFAVRELYKNPGWKLQIQKGVLRSGEKLKIQSKMRAGMVYVDGSHVEIPFPLGVNMEIKISRYPLKVYAYNVSRRKIFR